MRTGLPPASTVVTCLGDKAKAATARPCVERPEVVVQPNRELQRVQNAKSRAIADYCCGSGNAMNELRHVNDCLMISYCELQ